MCTVDIEKHGDENSSKKGGGGRGNAQGPPPAGEEKNTRAEGLVKYNSVTFRGGGNGGAVQGIEQVPRCAPRCPPLDVAVMGVESGGGGR